MFTAPPSLHLEVVYEHEDSFSFRLQQQKQHGNYTHPPSISASTVQSFPVDLFLNGSEENINKFKLHCEDNFPHDQQQQSNQKNREPSAALHKKVVKKMFACFPQENQMNVIQPLGEYLGSSNRGAQGLDRKEFSSTRNATNRFYHITPQLLVVYTDDLDTYAFPSEFQRGLEKFQEKNRKENPPMTMERYIENEKKKSEGVEQVRKDLKLLSLARPPGSSAAHQSQFSPPKMLKLKSIVDGQRKTVKFEDSSSTDENSCSDDEWSQIQKRYFDQKTVPCLCPCHEQHRLEKRMMWSGGGNDSVVGGGGVNENFMSRRGGAGVKFDLNQEGGSGL